jgi:hypothetical protein
MSLSKTLLWESCIMQMMLNWCYMLGTNHCIWQFHQSDINNMTEQCDQNGYASDLYLECPCMNLSYKTDYLAWGLQSFPNLSMLIPGHCLLSGLEHFHILLIQCSLSINNLMNTHNLSCCATNRKVMGSIPDDVIGIFHWRNPSGHTMALGSTEPLTEMSTRNISCV